MKKEKEIKKTKNNKIRGEEMRKHLSTIANDLIRRCAETLDVSVASLVDDFDMVLKPEVGSNYSRKLVEFCSSKALEKLSCAVGENITDGSFSRFTFDMMLAWESPSSSEQGSFMEGIAKEAEDRKEPLQGNIGHVHDDIPLFYSDIMPLLVDEEPSVGEEAFVWLASLLPLAADVVNARFTFETLTAPTASRLHYPAYDRFLKELDKCIKYLQKQSSPTGIELAEDEFILHVEGTASTQRVVRHIGASSWPGRLTLTNQALYFEASQAISYENALKIDLSNVTVDHQIKTSSTGPWGAPLFDKAITYESSLLPEPVVLEFPELTSSTRRDHWLTLIKEVILLHRFISQFDIESPLLSWEMHSRTILGIVRLHAAREMLRIASPPPTNFLIFSLYDELPKGDFVLEELSNRLKRTKVMHPCSATGILKSLNMQNPMISNMEVKEGYDEKPSNQEETNWATLEKAIDQAREEAKEVNIAKATVEKMAEEGITDSLLVLMELLSPVKNVPPWFRRILNWERPVMTLCVLGITLLIIDKEWIGYAIAGFLISTISMMLWIRQEKLGESSKIVVVSTSSDKSTMESIVNAQHSVKKVHEIVKTVNISVLRIQSILLSRAPKHTNQAMWVLAGVAILTASVPFKFILMGLTLQLFVSNSKAGKSIMSSSEQGNRRLREWWNTIPVVPVCTDSSVS